MTSTLITAYLGAGLAAARPATPVLAAGTFGFYEATDTGTLSLYYGGAWHTLATGIDPGAPPTVVQSAMAAANSASIVLGSAPINGNLLVAMCFNSTVGTPGAGWTSQLVNSSGTDFGMTATKVAGAGESTTQTPLSGAANGLIAMWEINGQAGSNFVINAVSQAEQAGGVFATPPVVPNVKDAITLACVSLVSTSNNVIAGKNMTQDQILTSGTTRQGFMGHATAAIPVGSPVVNFSGTGTPGNKTNIITITK
jgi:hypothetical protein